MPKISDDPKNIHMVVSRFEIKRKNKIVFRKNISNSMQAFTLEFLLKNMEIICLKSNISLFLPELWTETVKGLIISGEIVNSSIRLSCSNSKIASLTKSECSKAKPLFFKMDRRQSGDERNFISIRNIIQNKLGSADETPVLNGCLQSALNRTM